MHLFAEFKSLGIVGIDRHDEIASQEILGGRRLRMLKNECFCFVPDLWRHHFLCLQSEPRHKLIIVGTADLGLFQVRHITFDAYPAAWLCYNRKFRVVGEYQCKDDCIGEFGIIGKLPAIEHNCIFAPLFKVTKIQFSLVDISEPAFQMEVISPLTT